MVVSHRMPNVNNLPTLDKLGLRSPPDITKEQAITIAQEWFQGFSSAIESSDVSRTTSLFMEDGLWRDMLALTWNFRTFQGHEKIGKFLESQLPVFKPTGFEVDTDKVAVERPFPDVAWVQAFFNFTTSSAIASGIVRVVPTSDKAEKWIAHSIFTNLENLKDYPEKLGFLRSFEPNHGLWTSQRQAEIEYADGSQPTVVVVGGGQSGLEVAARLKVLGVSTLVIERQPRLGDNWRTRYQALCLHDPVWYDHMPYIPFPASWPVYTPAAKLADWLESYAHSMELNVWTKSSVEQYSYDEKSRLWTVDVLRDGQEKRTLKPKHVIMAAGWGGYIPNMPSYPGMDVFKGEIMHSSGHKTAKDYLGKKAVVVGACTSGHDISQDCYNHGVDITLYQRSSTYIMSTKHGMPILMENLWWENSPPTEDADRIFASYPNFMNKSIQTRLTAAIKEKDQELLDDLEKVGFRLSYGEDESGFLLLAWSRGGGYYLDVGASRLVADGKIKMKSGVPIKRFVEDAIEFEDGSRLEADVVVFATGFGDTRDHIQKLGGKQMRERIQPVWGLNEEGELNSAWRDCGQPGLWFMMGNLALCRFHSKHLALQIKALDEGVFDGKRY